MKRNKLLIVVTIMLLLIESCTLFLMYKSLNSKNNKLEISSKEIINNNMFAIMIEQDDGTYNESKDNKWPTDGYVYSESMSGCVDENGNKLEGILTYNNETNVATVDTTSTSHCYLYFEKESCVVPITNLLLNSSFENTGWNNCIYSTSIKKYGNYSCQMTGTTSIPELVTQNYNAINLNSNHIYYVRTEVYTNTPNGSFQVYWPIAEPSMGVAEIRHSEEWKIYGLVSDRSNFSSGFHSLRFDYNVNYQNIVAYYDGGMLIDLTESFGSGNEPNADWLNDNLKYFENTGNILYKPIKDAPTCPTN